MTAGSVDIGPVLLVAPAAPPYGGMALQATLLEECLRRDGIPTSFFASNFLLPTWLGPFRDTPILRTFFRAILIWPYLWRETAKVEIVHILAASWLYFFLVVCPAITVARIGGKRVVLNYRGGGGGAFFARWRWVLQPFFNAASIITAPSNFLAELIQKHFRRPVALVPNIVDFSLFRFRERNSAQPKLLVTRHLEKMYDVESVVRAFQMVQARHPEASLWIAGGGVEETNLRDLVTRLDLRSVRFLGHVAHRDLARIYDECDIFINASRVDNFPGALLEASAAGLPVVSTGAGGIPFIYEHRKSALLSAPGDWQALAASVEELLQSPALTAELSVKGSIQARQCDWTQVRTALYQAYGASADQHPARIATLA